MLADTEGLVRAAVSYGEPVLLLGPSGKKTTMLKTVLSATESKTQRHPTPNECEVLYCSPVRHCQRALPHTQVQEVEVEDLVGQLALFSSETAASHAAAEAEHLVGGDLQQLSVSELQQRLEASFPVSTVDSLPVNTRYRVKRLRTLLGALAGRSVSPCILWF